MIAGAGFTASLIPGQQDPGPRTPLGPQGNEEIVTNERYVVMPWKMVTRHGVNMTLK